MAPSAAVHGVKCDHRRVSTAGREWGKPQAGACAAKSLATWRAGVGKLYNNALSASNVLALYDAAIPEPATLALLGAGPFGIGTVRRRSRT